MGKQAELECESEKPERKISQENEMKTKHIKRTFPHSSHFFRSDFYCAAFVLLISVFVFILQLLLCAMNQIKIIIRKQKF